MRTPFVGAAALHIGNALAALPSAGIAAYGRQLQHMVTMSGSPSANRLAARPERYAQRIVAIAGKIRPRFQYNFGFDTAIVALMNALLPFRLLRAIKTSLFALEPR